MLGRRSTSQTLREIRRQRRAAARPVSNFDPSSLSLSDWALRYLAPAFSVPASPFHTWLALELDTLHTRRGSRLCVQAPRGAAKSSWASLAFPLREATRRDAPEPFIVIASDTSSQAVSFLRQIRREIESNERLQRETNCRPGRLWRDDHIQLANGSEIAALGAGAKIRGRKSASNRRPTTIVVDDPQNRDHITSALQRDRAWEWFTKDVLNAGEPSTNVVVLGTALHREAIVCRLQTTPGWTTRRFQSFVTWPDRMDLWREHELLLYDYDLDEAARMARARQYYDDNREVMDAGAEVLWTEREDLYSLMLLRAAIGHAAFESEKQNNPIDPASQEWPAEYFDWPGFWFDTWPAELDVRTIALDPSKGKDSRQGDYSAIVKYGRTRQGVEYVEADLARRTVDVQCHDLVRHSQEFHPDGVAVETNTFQELLLVPLEQAARLVHVELPTYRVDNSVPKPVRIRRLTTPLARRQMRFKSRSPGTMLLVQQMRDWPSSAHDDGCDSLECARRLAIELLNAKASRMKK